MTTSVWIFDLSHIWTENGRNNNSNSFNCIIKNLQYRTVLTLGRVN